MKGKLHKNKPQCKRCSLCCQYICVEFDTPKQRSDFEEIAWMLAHKGVQIRVEDGDWSVLVHTPCLYLTKNGCSIYEGRPRICRTYSPGTCDGAVNDDGIDDADHIFKSLDELRAYRDEHFPIRRKKKKAKKQSPRKKKVKKQPRK